MTIGTETLGNGATSTQERFGRRGGPVDPLNGTWLDVPDGSLVDHPLLRGLLQELPPKGFPPPQDWLDRWFEAARSILELIYGREGRH